nr:rhabdomeric opsin [Echiniscus testudo]
MGVGAYFAPLSVIIICYALIWLKVRRSESKFAHGLRDPCCKARRKQRKEVRLAKIIAMAILCWTIAWTPYLIRSLLGIFSIRNGLTPWTSQVPTIFAKSGSVYTPVISRTDSSMSRNAKLIISNAGFFTFENYRWCTQSVIRNIAKLCANIFRSLFAFRRSEPKTRRKP